MRESPSRRSEAWERADIDHRVLACLPQLGDTSLPETVNEDELDDEILKKLHHLLLEVSPRYASYRRSISFPDLPFFRAHSPRSHRSM